MSKQIDEEIIPKICTWYSYNGKRCRQFCKDEFCKKHTLLITDFEYLKNSKDLECSTKKDVKITPRSKEHLNYVMMQLKYETTYVDVYTSADIVEEGDITSDDFIELPDKTKYFYSGSRGQYKAKDIKILFVDYCKSDPIIKVNDMYYCKECYIKNAKKLDYPVINLIKQ